MALKLPHHPSDDLEAEAGAWLINLEPFGEASAVVGDFDAKVSPDFAG